MLETHLPLRYMLMTLRDMYILIRALNAIYDSDDSVGHNHVYSTAYTATSPLYSGIPVGTYVGFEDLRFPNSDFNYYDESFVFIGVSSTTYGSVPEPSTLVAGSIAIAPVRSQHPADAA